MAIKKIPLLVATTLCLAFTLLGCGSDDNIPSNEIPRLSDTKLEDFKFSKPISYFEERLFFVFEQNNSADNYKVTSQFNPETKENLTETENLYLSQAFSNIGMDVSCSPARCQGYFVTVHEEEVLVVNNKLDLMTLVGEVDTPAEIHFVFYSEPYFPHYYEEIDNGYMVLAYSGGCDGSYTEDLLEVDRLGNVTFIKNINTVKTDTEC